MIPLTNIEVTDKAISLLVLYRETIFKSNVCEKIVGVLQDSVNSEEINPPFETEEFDEKQKQQLTSWFETTKALLKEKVKIKEDLDRYISVQ